jgi:IS6 family transposase
MGDMFKRRRFPVEIILVCVRWYCKYGISYRDLVEMMQERGVEVDPFDDHAVGASVRA